MVVSITAVATLFAAMVAMTALRFTPYDKARLAELPAAFLILMFGDTSQKRQLRKIMENRSAGAVEALPPLIMTREPAEYVTDGYHRNSQTDYRIRQVVRTNSAKPKDAWQRGDDLTVIEPDTASREHVNGQPASYLCTTCGTRWGCTEWSAYAGGTVNWCSDCRGHGYKLPSIKN